MFLRLAETLAFKDATAADDAFITDILREAGLPRPGPDEPVRMLLARQANKPVGCIGVEVYGEKALLRSLAIQKDSQRIGLGSVLVEHLCQRLTQAGISEVFLLTTNAVDFFSKLRFSILDRNLVDGLLCQSKEFQLDACQSATCMHRLLKR